MVKLDEGAAGVMRSHEKLLSSAEREEGVLMWILRGALGAKRRQDRALPCRAAGPEGQRSPGFCCCFRLRPPYDPIGGAIRVKPETQTAI